MSPAGRWQRVRSVFEQAVDLDPAARAVLLQRDLADDAEARAEVERLLAAEGQVGGFLTPPGADTLAPVLPGAALGPRAGDRIGAYVLGRELGHGGQGTVWSATDTRVGRTVALKLLPGGAAWSGASLARFRREAAITSRLEHPGICTVYDVDLEADQPYVAMRLVEGESLAQRLARARAGEATIERATAVHCIEQAARALHAAHSVGVVHRDIKPGNLMITNADQVVVLDFGIARELAEEGPQLTRTGDVFGTPAYMAPEQIEGATTDARADVWALGVTLFEVLTLQQPFHRPTREGLYRAILTSDVPRTTARLPADLRVIVATALAKEPGQRYATALDLASDLAAFRAGRPIAARPVGTVGRLVRWMRREPRAALLTLGLLLALLVSAGVTGYLAAQRGRLAAGAIALAQRERDELARDVAAGIIRSDTAARIREVLAEDPRLTPLRAALALSLGERAHVDEALALLDEAPPDAEEPRSLARARAIVLRDGKRDAEADRIETALGEPQSAREAYFASVAAGRDGKPDADQRALEAIRLAFVFMPGASEVYLERLALCSSGEERQRAGVALERLFPDSALAWFYIGLAWSEVDPERSRAACRRAIELDVGLAQPYVMEHYFLMTDGDYEQAKAVFERGLAFTAEKSAERQRLLITRAKVCLGHSLFSEALDAAERALAIHDRSITVLLLKARAEFGIDAAAAQATLRRVLELAPDNAEAKELLGG
ncbi:MAG TPA: protein kinase [Planctomycetota bacterium]|nr:protein kinase [Planctomycetota bacterium]